MKRGLQVVMAILSLIPLAFGITGLMFGAKMHLPEGPVSAAMDNVFRYQSGFYLSLFIFIWWILPNIEKHKTVFRILILAIFIGGLGRVYSYLTIGPPPPQMIAGMFLELGAPLLILWQSKLAKDA